MFTNYLKVSIRNLLRSKGFSFINISGLAIGMACCFLIMIWVLDELSYDQYHEHAPELFRAIIKGEINNQPLQSAITPVPLGPALKAEFPEILESARILPSDTNITMRYGDKLFNETVVYADPSFLRMFTFPVVSGDLNHALDSPSSVVITEKVAKKYFGSENPIGKVLQMDKGYDYAVAAVIKDIPHNSHLSFDILMPFDILRSLGMEMDLWKRFYCITYVQLASASQLAEVNHKIIHLFDNHVNRNLYSIKLYLQSVTDIHLHSADIIDYPPPHGNITIVYIFSAVALFVLIIACINFMNLTTARSAIRAKEIGIRKVVGAQRKQLIIQFYGESFFLSIIALFFALVLTELFLPTFNAISGKALTLHLFDNGFIVMGLIGITLLTGIMAGSFPALFLSAFQPIDMLRGVVKSGPKGYTFRKFLILLQFTLSILLIITTMAAYDQLHYMLNKDLGYDKENVVVIKTAGMAFESYPAFKKELQQNAAILGITTSFYDPNNVVSGSANFDWEGKDPNKLVLINYNVVGYDFIKTLKIKLLEGRGFSEDFSSDRATGVILNEEAVKVMNLKSPLQARISAFGINRKIIGVVKNFHFQTLNKKIEPLVLMMESGLPLQQTANILIRIRPRDIPTALEIIEKTWRKVNPSSAFDYHFLDQDYERLYSTIQKSVTVLKYFSLLAVCIACIGLFGLVSFTFTQRTKEIGIRKVLGASTLNIIWLLSKAYFKLVLIANGIAWPIAYYYVHRQLQQFAYRIEISWSLYFYAAVSTLLITLITVFYQSFKVASANPVDSLRYE